MATIEEGIGRAGTADLIDAHVQEVVQSIRGALATDHSGRLRRDPDQLEYVQFLGEQGTATTEAFHDGSGLVRVADAMVSLATYLGMLVAFWARPGRRAGLRTILRVSRAGREDWSGDTDTAVMATLLRYHLQHQRLFGNAAKVGVDLPRPAEDYATLLSLAAHTFLLSHETAHFVLGHDTGAPSSVSIRSQVLEFEADTFGFELTRSTLTHMGVPGAHELARVGANLVFFGVGLVERSLFVRRAFSHPEATDRWERTERTFPSGHGDAQRRVMRAVDLAIDRAANVVSAIPHEHWAQTWRHRWVSPFHAPDYLRSIEQYDDLQSRQPASLTALLDQIKAEGGADLASGLALAHRGPDAVFTAWRMPVRHRLRLLDLTQPLTFFNLYQTIKKAPVLDDAGPPFPRELLALPAACIVQHLIKTEQEAP